MHESDNVKILNSEMSDWGILDTELSKIPFYCFPLYPNGEYLLLAFSENHNLKIWKWPYVTKETLPNLTHYDEAQAPTPFSHGDREAV